MYHYSIKNKIMIKFHNACTEYIIIWIVLVIFITILFAVINNNLNNRNNIQTNELFNINNVPQPLANFTEKMDVFSHAT